MKQPIEILQDCIIRIAQRACRNGEDGSREWPPLDQLKAPHSWKNVGETYAPQVAAQLGLGTLAPEPEPDPIPMLLWCPECGERHIDEGKFATKSHTTHACQHCGHVWRPAIVPTCGVQFLPGYKNA